MNTINFSNLSNFSNTVKLEERALKDNPDGKLKDAGQQPGQAQVSLSVSSSVSLSSSRGSVSHNTSLTYTASGVMTDSAAPVEEKPSVTKAATNILTHIEAQLKRDIADGATQEELASRLSAGLEGFLKGFGEAFDQLSGSGLLSPKVNAAIQQTYQNVLDGIDELAAELELESPVTDELRDQYANAVLSDEDGSGVGGEISDAVSDTGLSQADQNRSDIISAAQATFEENLELRSRQIKEKMEQAENGIAFPEFQASASGYSVSENRTFDFSLRTADGDLVTISIGAARSQSAEYVTGDSASGSSSYLSESSNSSSNFSLEVKGELDADELRAINDLLEQVGQVSDTFFNENVFDAFEMALDIGFDRDEIAGFSLNLMKEQTTRVDNPYADVAKLEPEARQVDNTGLVEERDHKLALLSDFVEMLDDLRTKSEAMIEREGLTAMIQFVADNSHSDHPRLNDLTPIVDDLLSGLSGIDRG